MHITCSLLDIGPNAEGEIIEPMVKNLLDAGEWLKHSGDCVYGTVNQLWVLRPQLLNIPRWQDYWFPGSEYITSETSLRFLTTPNTFCIVALSYPSNGQLIVNKRLPILPGDEIVLLSPYTSGRDPRQSSDPAVGLPWSVDDSTGYLIVNVSKSDLDGINHAWAFQVRYKGC